MKRDAFDFLYGATHTKPPRHEQHYRVTLQERKRDQ